jgi:hypothetical protein
MTQTTETAAPPRVRRPPAPDGRWASLTVLTPPGAWLSEQVPTDAVQGTLALDLGEARGAPLTPELRAVPAEAATDLRAWSARFAQAVVEVVGGDRPLPQLLRWTSAAVYSDLDRRVRILARTSPAPQRRRTIRPQVRSVRVFQPEPYCAEVSVHVRHGQRSRAIAARLELEGGRWSCTVLELG